MISSRRSLVFFDFDGTLADFVPDRTKATLNGKCREMIELLISTTVCEVAVISSRSLDDLAPRVDMPGVYLGGNCGMVWRMPEGIDHGPGDSAEQALAVARQKAMPAISKLKATMKEIEVEDKKWSCALHVRNSSKETICAVDAEIKSMTRRFGIVCYRGEHVYELCFLPDTGKKAGVTMLCRLIRVVKSEDCLVYAGDDENDAEALKMVMQDGGTGYIVGTRISCPGAHRVRGPAELSVRILRDFATNESGGNRWNRSS